MMGGRWEEGLPPPDELQLSVRPALGDAGRSLGGQTRTETTRGKR
jgi:hypothetical protein